jgi:hypothetical protein
MSRIRIEEEKTFETATAEFTFPAEAGSGEVTIDLFATANGKEESYQFPVKLLPADSRTGTSDGGCSMGGRGLIPACGALALLPFLRRRRR